jgi:hypothetical protein
MVKDLETQYGEVVYDQYSRVAAVIWRPLYRGHTKWRAKDFASNNSPETNLFDTREEALEWLKKRSSAW